jgi:hypothetical protein
VIERVRHAEQDTRDLPIDRTSVLIRAGYDVGVGQERRRLAKRLTKALKPMGARMTTGHPLADDVLELPIKGQPVSMVSFATSSPYLRLHFWGVNGLGPYLVLEIEGDALLLSETSRLPVAIRPNSLAHPAALTLLGRQVVRAVARQSGALEMSFDGGAELAIAPSRWEPWQLVDQGGEYLVVSVAGGGLVVFGRPSSH